MLLEGIDHPFLSVAYYSSSFREQAEPVRFPYIPYDHQGSPLIISADVRGTNKNNSITNDMMELLGNTEVISIDQDALGQAGDRIAEGVWARRLQGGAVAVALMNRYDSAKDISLESWIAAGLDVGDGGESNDGDNRTVTVRDVWKQKTLTTTAGPREGWTAQGIPAHSVVLLRANLN